MYYSITNAFPLSVLLIYYRAMPYHKYPFNELHPDVYAECLKNHNWIFFWLDGELVHDHKLDPSDSGYIPLTLPFEKRAKLTNGEAAFKVTTQYIENIKSRPDGSDYPPRTFVVTGHFTEIEKRQGSA